MHVTFYAEPIDPDCVPKQIADKESLKAEWVTIQEFIDKGHTRGEELVEFGMKLEKGCLVAPMELFKE